MVEVVEVLDCLDTLPSNGGMVYVPSGFMYQIWWSPITSDLVNGQPKKPSDKSLKQMPPELKL
jgi:hypothetical protein